MALNNLGLGFVFTAREFASPVMGRLEQNFQSLERSTEGFSARLAGAGAAATAVGAGMALAGAAALSALEAPIDSSIEFGKALGEVKTLVDEAAFSTQQMKEITSGLSSEFAVAPTEAAAALYQTISAGAGSAAEANTLLRSAAKLSVGGVTSLTTAVDGLTSIVNAYGVSAERADEVTDTFFVAIKEGKTTADELGSTIGRVAAQANSLNVGFDELFGAVSTITKGGIQTSEAVSGLKQVFANITKPAKDAADEAKRLGIEFNSAALRSQGLAGFLDSITNNAKFADDSFEKLFGSVEALNAVQALTAQNGTLFADVMAAMDAKAGATTEAFKKMEQTLAFQSQRFDALKKQASILIGDALAPLVRIALSVATTLLKAFNAIPAPARTFLVVMFAVAAATLLVTGLIIGLGGAFVLALPALKAAGAAFVLMLKVLAPLAIAVALVGLVIAGFVVAARRNIGGFGDFLAGTFEKVKLFFKGITQLFSTGEFSGAVLEELNQAENRGVKAFAIRIFVLANRIKSFFVGIADGFSAGLEAAGPVFETLVGALTRLGQALGLVAVEGEDFARNRSEFNRFAQAGIALGEILGAVASFMVQGLTFAINVVTSVISGLRLAWNAVEEAVGIVLEAFRSLGAQFGVALEQLQLVRDGVGSTGFTWQTLGNIIGAFAVAVAQFMSFFVVAVATALELVAPVVGGIMGLFNAILDQVEGWMLVIGGILTGDWARVWRGARRIMFGAVNGMLSLFSGFVEAIAAAVDKVAAIFGKDLGAQAAVRSLRRSLEGELAASLRVAGEVRTTQVATGDAGALTSAGAGASPSVADSASRAGSNRELAQAMRESAAAQAAASERLASRPTQVRLDVDGDTLATATTQARREDSMRSFAPVPAT